MRSLGILVLLLLTASFLYTGCKQAEEVVQESEQAHEEAKEQYEDTISDKVAPEVWTLIQTENYRLNWKQWEGKRYTYVNPIAYEAIQNKDTEFPIGSIIVSERYGDQGNLDSIAVASRNGGNEKTNGWFSAYYAPDGQVIRVREQPVTITP